MQTTVSAAKNSVEFLSDNNYLFSMIVAVLMSTQTNLFSEHRNPPLSFTFTLSLIFSTLIPGLVVPLGLYFKISDKFSQIDTKLWEAEEQLNQSDESVVDPTVTNKIQADRDSFNQKKGRVNFILGETFMAQIVLTTLLLLIIGYEHNSMNGQYRFLLETSFYIIQTIDYGWNSSVLQHIFKETDQQLNQLPSKQTSSETIKAPNRRSSIFEMLLKLGNREKVSQDPNPNDIDTSSSQSSISSRFYHSAVSFFSLDYSNNSSNSSSSSSHDDNQSSSSTTTIKP